MGKCHASTCGAVTVRSRCVIRSDDGCRMNRIDALIRKRVDERRNIAQRCVSRLVRDAEGRGVEISVFGSLAKGRFHLHSDIDLLVHGRTDPARRAMVERLVADHLRGAGIPYDLIFASDIPAGRVQELLHDGV